MKIQLKKIADKARGLGRIVKNWKQRVNDHVDQNFKGTLKGLYWPAIILFGLAAGLIVSALYWPSWLGTGVFILLGWAAAVILLWLLKKVAGFLGRIGITAFLSWMLLFLVCITLVFYDAFVAGTVQAAGTAFFASLIMALFFKSGYAVVRNKVRTKTTLLSFSLSGVLVAVFLFLLFGKGFEDTYINTYLNLGNGVARTLTEAEKENFLSGTSYGTDKVGTVSYGTGTDGSLSSRVVDISPFAEEKGMKGAIKEASLGYTLKNVPVSGMVWYPLDKENCPTLFIVHGNHSYTTQSYLGYAYLGEYLASNGYVVVSVDENACNATMTGENDARAVLLLENIRQLESYNKDAENVLYKKMDYDNLALAGHSRGGEAAAAACLFNRYDRCPDNGNIVFDYDYNIRSIVAIAPSVNQYQPGDRGVELEDVNYMVLHCANDQDVTDFMGMQQYENVTFSGKEECLKTSLYIAGGNHGQFNSEWGLYDISEPFNRGLNVANFISEQEQQQIAQIFIKVFLDTTLRKDFTNAKLLTSYEAFTEFLPRTLYVQSFRTSDFTCLADFEEDSRIDSATMEGAFISVRGCDVWKEVLLSFSSGSSRENYAMELTWDRKSHGEEEEAPYVRMDFPVMDVSGAGLQFDIMDMSRDFKESEAALLQAEVLLEDEHGVTCTVPMEDYAVVYPGFMVKLNKVQYLFGKTEYKNQLATVFIPAKAFSEIETKLDLEHIVGLEISFLGEQGKAVLDNIGFFSEKTLFPADNLMDEK